MRQASYDNGTRSEVSAGYAKSWFRLVTVRLKGATRGTRPSILKRTTQAMMSQQSLHVRSSVPTGLSPLPRGHIVQYCRPRTTASHTCIVER